MTGVVVLYPLLTTSKSPPPRKQATLVGDRLYIFGGEDCNRRPLADLYILDLSTLTWTAVDVPGKPHAKPPPRCGHAAVVYQDKLIVFGGGLLSFWRGGEGRCLLRALL
jgi:hypothetical protein